MDAEGNVIAKPKGRSVKAFKQGASDVARFLELKAKESPTDKDKVDLLSIELDLGKIEVADAKKRLGELTGLSPELKEELTKKIQVVETDSTILKAQPRSQADAIKAGKGFYEMFQKGTRPTDEQATQLFYICIMEYGYSQSSVEIVEPALQALKDLFASQPQAERFFKQQEARLQKLKGGG